ncbi:MAG: polyphosphate polymerase domain-containing protein [bacterium]|nr:polyphosphate polymerase domain-containing protein [bacterium]
MAKPTLHFQRFEFKYFLPKHKVKQLIAALLTHMVWDPNARETGFYRVNSLYFDSPDYGCFWDKEAGVADRKKMRLRYYGDLLASDTPVFAEIKRKKDALIIKDRVGLLAKDCAGIAFEQKIRELSHSEKDNGFLQELMWFIKRNAMRPKVHVTYNRRALFGKRDKRFRVTIDENIESRLQPFFGESKARLPRRIYPHGVVFEVKYHNVLPSWFHRVLQTFELQRLAYSKYGNSVRMILPQFNDNNYQLSY